MSVKSELAALKREKHRLEDILFEIRHILSPLYVSKSSLTQKIDVLKNRTSPLAQNLLKSMLKEIKKVEQEIIRAENKQADVKRKLEEVEQNIFLHEVDTGLFIQEQSSIMVSAFLEYLGNHLTTFGLEIKKTFYIREVKKSNHGEPSTPTGNLAIYEKVISIDSIVASSDFFFENDLFTISTDEDNHSVCNETEWYKSYVNRFISVLLETLQREYSYEEFFNLTIGDSCFTLELV